MTPEELHVELAAQRLRPAYLLAGEEALLRDEALAAIRVAALSGVPADFNFDRLEGEATTPVALLDALRTLPVLAPRRLVWVRGPDAGGAAGRALLEALPAIVRELRDEASAVLVVTVRTADGRAPWVRAFADPAVLVRCQAPRGAAALAAFVRREAQRQGVSLASGVAEALAQRIGPQLLVIRSELAKAALLAGAGRPVTRAEVIAAVADVAEEPIWELTDAIGAGRAGAALAVLGKLLGAGAPPPLLLGSLAAHFRRLLRLRTGGVIGGPPFVVHKLESQARRYSPARLLGCLEAIQQTDEVLKGGQGGIPSGIALERLVLGLAA